MVIKPAFKLTAKGKDITDDIKKNLMALSFDDCDGLDSDELTFSVSGVFERPIMGDTLTLALGLAGKLYDYGEFKVQTTGVDHKAQTTEIRATAVDFSGTLKERKSRLWEAVSLADITKQIATDNKLAARTSCADSVMITSKAQDDTSDIVFIRLLANEHGFTCVIKDNAMIIAPKGEKCTDLPEITVDKKECHSLNVERAAKNAYGSVEIIWQDVDSGTIQKVTAGKGSPVYYIKNVQPKTPDEGAKIAEAKLKELNQCSVSGSLSITGGRKIRAGGFINLTGAGSDSGKYKVDKATHSLSTSQYIVNMEFSGNTEKEEI